MNKDREMLDAVEMHVERMLAKVSEQERKENTILPKFEEKMRDVLKRLNVVVNSQEDKTRVGESNADL